MTPLVSRESGGTVGARGQGPGTAIKARMDTGSQYDGQYCLVGKDGETGIFFNYLPCNCQKCQTAWHAAML